ncbi:early endosome antigen 1 [Parasteatoda tepidariorum]|uniref:early endosome antigen 1 n=1 Tax=Parasteatoda tepidariorum TaxID=114398 RepID=UPI00077FA4FE|nr:putative leucine-rich repeat-containing protein DDB_G0290503 [Parasteatoda tepidariorum]XP_015907431.1 putative leucine-rich repeat-containing protein DDB_G0290503 [Parasteatoda tepidariorum]
MPGNSNAQLPTAPKSSLVRSKSLRLTTSRPKLEQSGTSTLTRHGSIRGPKTQNPALSSSKPSLSVFKKPALKPKPSFSSSKSNDQIENSAKTHSNAEGDSRKTNINSPIKHSDGKGIPSSDSHLTPSESPTSLHSDKSHSQDGSSWCNSDLVSHLKRLTEEHEKLQVEYARQRIQLLENVSVQPVSNLRRDQQHLSQSDSHLASIPENSADAENGHQSQTETLEAAVQNFKSEVIRLQEDNRKLQRKYWDQILNSELVMDESCNGASLEIVNLIDKLDEREKELHEATGKVQELENHLAGSNLELQQCQDALSDQQRMLEDANVQREEYGKHLRELRSALLEAKDHIDFLQIERSTSAEAYQETEQSLLATKAELSNEKSKNIDMMDRTRKLYAKIKDYALQVQLLRAELDRTQGSCRDMLLSQGAELTMISMHLSQISMNAHTMLTAAADFAATELSLQKEMLEEIMADLDSESDNSFSQSEQNGILKSDSHISNLAASSQDNIKPEDKVLDIHKSLPDIFCSEPIKPLHSPAASENERPVSLVQSMVRAYEQTAKNDAKLPKQNMSKSFSEQNSDSAKSSIENLSSINGDFSHISSISKDSSPVASSAFKPIGMATAFRPVRQRSLESEISPIENINFEEEKKTSVETQLNQMNSLIKKVGKVIELTQEKFLLRMKTLIEEKNSIQDELRSCKNKQYQMQADLNNKDILIERSNEKFKQLSSDLKKNEAEYEEEKENLLSKNTTLTEEIRCLEAVNTELNQQLTLKLEKSFSESNHGFRTNAEDICDKLTLKQEIAKLKAIIEQKEKLLQQLSQKFSRTKLIHEQNLKQAEKEIEILDNVILKVYTTLETNSELVEKNEVLQNLRSLVSGNCTLPNVCPSEDKK